MLKQAIPLQYSVFLFEGDDRQLDRFMQGAIELINEKQDDLRVYPLPNRGLKARIGRPTLPAGIQWGNMPTKW